MVMIKKKPEADEEDIEEYEEEIMGKDFECPKCGTVVADGESVCSDCGTEFDDEIVGEGEEELDAETEEEEL